MFPKQTIAEFDEFLASKGLHFEATVIGGSALALLGVTDRPTRDFDILHPHLSEEMVAIAREFAQVQRKVGVPLADDWLNNGPEQLGEVLPAGWQERLQVLFEGRAIRLSTLGREDLLKSKMFALCDRGEDWNDCIALFPTELELMALEPWLSEQDAHSGWPEHVLETILELKRRLGHAV